MVTVIEEKSSRLFKNPEALKLIKPNPRSLGFGTWISEIYLCCDEFYEDYDINKGQDPALKTEEQLRDALKSLVQGDNSINEILILVLKWAGFSG